MSLKSMAGLGNRPGCGESLTSWLRAGPLSAEAWTNDLKDIGAPVLRDAVYCPKCYLSERGRKRWYTKAEWIDPRQVICSEHGLPLIRCAGSVARLRSPELSQAFHGEARSLSGWVAAWQQRSPCTPGGWLVSQDDCLEDQILSAFAGQAYGQKVSIQAFWLSHWRLRLEGWPLPSAPHACPTFQMGLIAHQMDRLALVGTVQRISSCLLSEKEGAWPPLLIDRTGFSSLRAAMLISWPHLVGRLSRVFIPGY